MRIVFDTNVLISSILSKRGIPNQALRWASRNAVILSCQTAIIEFMDKLTEPKFSSYVTPEEAINEIAIYTHGVEMIEILENHGITASSDPDDNIFLAIAKIGKADFIVSGDKRHLLPLGSFEGVPILSPADFLARVNTGK